MRTIAMPRPTRAHTLTAAQLRELREELERERRRFADADPQHQPFSSALQRIDEGTYGACVHCGEPIPYGRLIAMPETTFCLGCRGKA